MASGHAIKYTQPMLEWVQANQADITRSELTEMFNDKFNMDLGRGTLAALCKRKGWKSSHSGRIEKGAVPWNKDKKGYMGANATSFKKGDRPKNHRPVGSERITKDGYIQVKIAEPRKWRLKHIVVWESVNGALPKGHCIRLLDNDRTNCSIDNLICISRGANATSNRCNKADTSIADLNKAILMTEHLKDKVRKQNVKSKSSGIHASR
jgi:hypothetical protein